GHQALRNNFASSLLLRTWLPYDWTPRSEAYFVFPLAQGTLGKQCGLAATGVYQPSLRSPWLAAGVGAVFWGAFFHEHDHQHLEQHDHGLEQSAAVCRHLARGAQALEFTFQCVELLAQRLFVDGGHDRCLTRIRPRPRPRPPAPRGVPPAAVPGSSSPSSRHGA
ncbi:hypothetical protein, partial [Thiolapillus sp.]|uniref:hypothetical protein n=2 Tax=Thiolapillus sp. TaxID=2017437 RepID=UPI003AF628A1